MDNLGVEDPAVVLSCGDTQADVKSAHAAGVASVGVLTGHLEREDFQQLGTDYILDSVADVAADMLEG